MKDKYSDFYVKEMENLHSGNIFLDIWEDRLGMCMEGEVLFRNNARLEEIFGWFYVDASSEKFGVLSNSEDMWNWIFEPAKQMEQISFALCPRAYNPRQYEKNVLRLIAYFYSWTSFNGILQW